jgi:hypothetical protein
MNTPKVGSSLDSVTLAVKVTREPRSTDASPWLAVQDGIVPYTRKPVAHQEAVDAVVRRFDPAQRHDRGL